MKIYNTEQKPKGRREITREEALRLLGNDKVAVNDLDLGIEPVTFDNDVTLISQVTRQRCFNGRKYILLAQTPDGAGDKAIKDVLGGSAKPLPKMVGSRLYVSCAQAIKLLPQVELLRQIEDGATARYSNLVQLVAEPVNGRFEYYLQSPVTGDEAYPMNRKVFDGTMLFLELVPAADRPELRKQRSDLETATEISRVPHCSLSEP